MNRIMLRQWDSRCYFRLPKFCWYLYNLSQDQGRLGSHDIDMSASREASMVHSSSTCTIHMIHSMQQLHNYNCAHFTDRKKNDWSSGISRNSLRTSKSEVRCPCKCSDFQPSYPGKLQFYFCKYTLLGVEETCLRNTQKAFSTCLFKKGNV